MSIGQILLGFEAKSTCQGWGDALGFIHYCSGRLNGIIYMNLQNKNIFKNILPALIPAFAQGAQRLSVDASDHRVKKRKTQAIFCFPICLLL